jgi:carbonic anhydrase
VLRQVFHVATSPVVASAWSEGQELHVYGLIYDVADGHLRKLAGPIRCVPGVCTLVCAWEVAGV